MNEFHPIQDLPLLSQRLLGGGESPKVGLHEGRSLAWVDRSSASLEVFFYLYPFIQPIASEFLSHTKC